MAIAIISKQTVPDPLVDTQILAELDVDGDTFSMIVPDLPDLELQQWLEKNDDVIKQTIARELAMGSDVGQRIRISRVERYLQNVTDAAMKNAMQEMLSMAERR